LLADRWVRVAALVALLWFVGYAAATALVDSDRAALVLSDVVSMAPVVAAAGLSITAALRAPRTHRVFWGLLSVATTTWLAGGITWAILDLGLGREPFPSIADVFYLTTYVFAIAAVLFGLGAGLSKRSWRGILDASVLVAALGVTGYELLIEPQLAYGTSLSMFVGIAYPLCDVTFLMLLTGVGYAARRALTPAVKLVAVSYLVGALTDFVYTYLSVTQTSVGGSWIALGWQLAGLLVCVAAVSAVRDTGAEPQLRQMRPDRSLPLVLVGMAAAVTVVAVDLANGRISIPVALLGIFAIATVVVRLVLSVRHQKQLVTALQARSRTLSVQARALESTLTQHERAERERERSVSLLTATLEATADGILVVDRNGRIVGSNRKFRELWRISDELMETGDDSLVMQSVLDQIVDPEAFVAKVRELYDSPESQSFDTVEFHDGRLFERLSMPQRVGGESVGRVWSFRDVTDRSRLEHELRHAQKMEAVGRLAGGIAHDFNNLLTAIMGHADLLLARVEETPSRRAAVEIRRASERASTLTSQLLAFSRKQMLQPKIVDLNNVVEGMGGLLSPLLGETIELVTTPAPEPVAVAVDPGQIEQVVANLVINARDAMPQGGRIDVEAARADSGEVVLRVRDTGLGMDEATLQQAFEPFFTTKPMGAGTGLGLSTVLGIVEQSGGRVAVESSPGAGTTVELTLPAAAGEPEELGALRPAAPVRDSRTGGSLLLVEDEAVVRDLLHDVLVEAGHEVLVACDGLEALVVSQAHDGPIDVLLTDLVMPGMSGRELAERITELRPAIDVVYMSGYTEDAVVRHGVREDEANFLQKPFTLSDVVDKVDSLLAGAARHAA
jgi:two-component system, cell cycle sensor histidine kinase and response regulator CckA